MVQEQFGQFWLQLKAPLKARWDQIDGGDLEEIEGNLAMFTDMLGSAMGMRTRTT